MSMSQFESKLLITGIVTIVVTVFAMALTDAIVKFASGDMTLWQIYVLRSLLAIPVLLWFVRGQVGCPSFGWVMVRSLALVMMYLAIYAAIPILDLSVIAASLYTSPLFIVILSALLLRDRIGSLHYAAILLGFAGVLLIIRPTASGFSLLSLIPVAAAFLYAVAAVVTRAKCSHVPAMVLALWLNIVILLFGALASAVVVMIASGSKFDYPFLFGTWAPMRQADWWTIGILAVLILCVSVGLARAYQSPQPYVIATFDYAYLVFASFWGFVFFNEVPTRWTIAGMALIASAGMIALTATRQIQASKSPVSPV